MSELIGLRKKSEDSRRNLLANVSLVALLGCTVAFSGAQAAVAGDNSPSVWIELGGQLERVDGTHAVWTPAFFDLAQPAVLATLEGSQRPSRYSSGAEGKISLMPRGSNWVLSAALRYGRVQNSRHLHYQTPGLPTVFGTFNKAPLVIKPARKNFGDGQTTLGESHFVIDFQAGKDVGLGLFGNSVVSAGVRYTQFTSRSDETFHARPVLGYSPAIQYVSGGKYHSVHKVFRQTYTATLHTARNTRAVGPSLSWDGSVPVIESHEGMMVGFEWGLNAAALFGRQRTLEDHRTTGYSLHYNGKVKSANHYTHIASHNRSRSVFIPNVGGFAGVSLKFPNAKVNVGYRGDFFFNATDSGIDVRDAANQSFYGPFATISIGLGR